MAVARNHVVRHPELLESLFILWFTMGEQTF